MVVNLIVGFRKFDRRGCDGYEGTNRNNPSGVLHTGWMYPCFTPMKRMISRYLLKKCSFVRSWVDQGRCFFTQPSKKLNPRAPTTMSSTFPFLSMSMLTGLVPIPAMLAGMDEKIPRVKRY